MDLRQQCGGVGVRKKTRTPECRNCVLLKSLVASGMSAANVESICNRMWLNRVSRRQLLTMEGGPADRIFTLRRGRVKLFRLGRSGRLHVSGILASGDMFGLEALFADRYTLAAEAMSDCEVCSASAAEVKDLMREVPSFSFDLTRYLHYQLDLARERLAFLGTADARTRVAGFLLRNGDGRGGRGGRAIEIERDLTLPEIGGVLGLSGETVSRVLGALKDDGIVDVSPSRIRVLDLSSLERAARV